MSVLKYKDPVSGEWMRSGAVKLVEVVEGDEVVVKAAEQLTASGYPDYIQPEVAEMVGKIQAVRQGNSIVFIAMADSHYFAEQELSFYEAETNASALQANQAAKVLCYLVKPDFFAHLGDVSCGHDSTTPAMLTRQIEGFISMFREARSDLPVFVCIGNHDTGIYYHDEMGDGDIHTMTGEYLYKNFTSLSESEDTVMGGEENGGYCYRDFADKKLRVIMLNTSEKLVAAQNDQATFGAQRVWLANALLDLNAKADAVDWGFIILCHYPADYGGNMPLSELLRAYVEGASFTITDPVSDYYVGDGTSRTVNFGGKNGAKFIAQFHGHIHNFKTDKLYSYATGNGVQYDAHRVCIPNGQYGRENTYTTVGNKTDIDYSEDSSYPKAAGTANGTSFVVNVINPSEERIYSFCYGAGYDRVIGYGSAVYYSVASKLTGVTTSNEALSVESGTSYTATLTPFDGYTIKSVAVTMGEKDITAKAYKNGVVTISEVTGNIVITAKAKATENFTNLVPLSVNADGTDFNVDGDGYDNDTYINSSGVAAARKGCTSMGFMPVKAGPKTIRMAGDGISIDTEYTRFAFYDANFNLLNNVPCKRFGTSVYYGDVIEEDATLITWVMNKETLGQAGVYMRVCTPGDGADMIVTVDEEITYGS
jgi:predicted MPP superfamily phosphohydrolase